MKKKQFLTILATAIMLIPAYGCTPAARQETGYVGNVNLPGTAGNIGPNRGIRNSSAYVFRPDVADHLRTHIPGVTQASVFVRGNNAYVAVSDGAMPRTGNLERVAPHERIMPQGDINGRIIHGGTAGGTLNRPTPGALPGIPGGPAVGVPGATGGTATGVPSVDGRTGGYIGGAAPGRISLPQDMKQRIATEVRRVDPAIANVYVSDDPALLSRFRGHGTGSLRSAADDMNNIIRNFFPGAR